MGRQAYVTRVALGRSAYDPLERPPSDEDIREARAEAQDTTRTGVFIPEPAGYIQRYDRRGYPENLASRLLNRRSRRAQNDVLASVGVCIDVRSKGWAVQPQFRRRQHSVDKSRVAEIRRENEIGLLVAAFDWGFFWLVGSCILGLQYRTQAFRFYSGVPLLEIIRIEWKHFGPWKFLLAGTPANVLYHTLDICRIYAIRLLYNFMVRHVLWQVKSEERSKQIRTALDCAEYILKITSFIAITPFEIFATLQRLDLVPAWPFFPKLITLVPFTSGSPFQAHDLALGFSMTSCTHFLNSLVLSPLLLWPILFFGRMHLEQTIYAYLSLALPKPDNPDRYSLKGAMEDGLDSDTIPGLDIPRSKIYLMGSKSVNLLEEIKKDACAMARVFWDAFSSWTPKKKTAEQNLNDVQDAENPRIVPMSPQPADSLGSEREIIVPLFSLSQRSSPVPMPYVNTSQNSPEHSVLPSTSPLARPRASSRASSQAPQRESDNNTLQTPQISTRAEEATILDSMAQNLSIPEPEGSALMDELPMPDYEEARISSQVEAQSAPKPESVTSSSASPYHRVTVLTAHLADGMCCHLSSHLSQLLCLPLETLLIRSIALGFLSATPTRPPTALGLRDQVFPLGTWFGIGLKGGVRGMADYAGRLALCAALDMGVSLVFWQVGAGIVWWIRGRYLR